MPKFSFSAQGLVLRCSVEAEGSVLEFPLTMKQAREMLLSLGAAMEAVAVGHDGQKPIVTREPAVEILSPSFGIGTKNEDATLAIALRTLPVIRLVFRDEEAEKIVKELGEIVSTPRNMRSGKRH